MAQGRGSGTAPVERGRKRGVLEGRDAARSRKAQGTRRSKRRAGARAAKRGARACSAPPAGCARGTRKWLAGRLVERESGERLAEEPVRETLKKSAPAGAEAVRGHSTAPARPGRGSEGGGAGP